MKSPEKQKNLVRNKIILQRKSMENAQIGRLSILVIRNFLKALQIDRANNVLLYIPINGEVDTKYAFDHFQKMHSTIFVPVYLKADKRWVISKFEGFHNLEAGPFKTLQPRDILVSPVSALDLAIIPAVAFSKDLFRLGYGKGVYDKLLGGSNVLKIGLAYDFQIVNDLHAEPHDIKMDIVVTEKKLYTGKPGNI